MGSGSDCQIRLIDPSVSAYHCSLVHTARGVWAIDLLGQSGLRVNGQEVSDARVFEGDVVQVGHSEIRLTAGDSGSGVLARGAASPAVRVADLAPPEPPSLPPVAEAVPVVAVVPPESRDEVEAESRAPDIAPPEERPWPPAATPAVAVAAAPAVPSAPGVAVVEQVLASVVSQVGEMQRQMLEDFQQARMALQETFASLHQEQTAFLDHELDQLQRISQELQGLRDQLRRQTDELAERLAAMPATAAPRPQPALLAAPSPSAPHSEGTLATPINGASPRNGNAPHVDSDVAWTSPRRESSHDENIHAQLCERIARIQSEHQSRWRKLLGLLPNKPGKPADR